MTVFRCVGHIRGIPTSTKQRAVPEATDAERLRDGRNAPRCPDNDVRSGRRLRRWRGRRAIMAFAPATFQQRPEPLMRPPTMLLHALSITADEATIGGVRVRQDSLMSQLTIGERT